jgi:hypothetical protein
VKSKTKLFINNIFYYNCSRDMPWHVPANCNTALLGEKWQIQFNYKLKSEII